MTLAEMDELAAIADGFAAKLEGATEMEIATKEYAVSNDIVLRRFAIALRAASAEIAEMEARVSWLDADRADQNRALAQLVEANKVLVSRLPPEPGTPEWEAALDRAMTEELKQSGWNRDVMAAILTAALSPQESQNGNN